MRLTRLSGGDEYDCYPNRTCPGVWDTDTEDVAVVGTRVIDSDTLARLPVGAHECALLIPRPVMIEAARKLLGLA
ncbi:MAG: hypothetical protein ACRDYA_24580 [Egibacteraceae bacterium]